MSNKKIVFDNLQDAITYVYSTASKYACKGVIQNIGGPFGAGIILIEEQTFRIISIARNSVLKNGDPTCHAEVNAIRQACKKLGTPFLRNCILVTTAKSCPMCLSAAIWAQIKTIYYSENYESATAADFKDDAIAEYIKGKKDGKKSFFVGDAVSGRNSLKRYWIQFMLD